MKQLNIEVTEAQHTALKVRAAKQGTTVRAIVTKALEQILKKD